MVRSFISSALLVTLLHLFPLDNSCAKDSFVADLKKSYPAKKINKSRQYVIFGGAYSSDYNSKEHEISVGYKYKGPRMIHEIDFLHEETMASTTTKPMRKTEDLYDFEMLNRMLIKDSNNYLNLYNRVQYDEFDFYYETSNAVGFGRILFDSRIEIDANIGYNNLREENSQIIFIPTLKIKHKVSKNVKFSSKYYFFKTESEYEEELKSSISFKIEKNLSLGLYHKYSKDRYIYHKTKKGVVVSSTRRNRVKRSMSVKLKYTF